MFIRAGANAFLDPSAGKLDTISAEPLRIWKVTGAVEAIEAFRVAVGGVALPDEGIVAVLDLTVVVQKVTEKKVEVVDLKGKLDKATVELTDLQATAAQLQTDATPIDTMPVIAE